MTVSVKGEWNWLSHDDDYNYDRAATGAAILGAIGTARSNKRTITTP